MKRIWYMSIKKAARGYKISFLPVQKGIEREDAAFEREQEDLSEVEGLIRRVRPIAFVGGKILSEAGLLGISTLPEEPLEKVIERVRGALEGPEGSAGVMLPLLTRNELEEMARESRSRGEPA